MSAVTSVVRNNVMGKVEVEVAGFDPLVLLYDQGNGSLGPIDKFLNERVRVQRRGTHLGEFWGARMYPAFSLTSYLTELIASDSVEPGSLAEALLQVGAYDDAGSLVPPTCTIRWTVYGAVAEQADDEVFTLHNCSCRITTITEAIEGNTFAIEAGVLGAVDVTRGGKTITFDEINAA